MVLTVGSVFSGAGGFDIGFDQAGYELAWLCEIDPAARGVLQRHWPGVPCFEDVRTIPADVAAVDVVLAGFPCQDVSVAGRRAGLAGSRTGLFWSLLDLVERIKPRWLVLENVPGLLSSNKGRDMGAVLWALGELGYGWSYRCLDAQHWGVPQRRRRVFIVGHSGADTRRAAQVLFESDRGEGDSEEGGAEGQELAYCLSASAGSSSSRVGQGWNTTFVAATLRSRNHAPGVNAPGRGGEDDQNLVIIDEQNAAAVPMVGSLSTGGAHSNRGFAIANTVQASAGHHGHSSPRGGGGDNLVVAHCLNGSQERLDGTVETFVTSLAENQRGELRTADVSPALGAGGGKPGSGFSAAWNGSTVRRLMPIETERLQGWADNWTSAAYGRWLKDGPRYRLVGNGIASPVARWLAERILEVEHAT